jgi:hypothetical protein
MFTEESQVGFQFFKLPGTAPKLLPTSLVYEGCLDAQICAENTLQYKFTLLNSLK